jgi:hypothetical protein
MLARPSPPRQTSGVAATAADDPATKHPRTSANPIFFMIPLMSARLIDGMGGTP